MGFRLMWTTGTFKSIKIIRNKFMLIKDVGQLNWLSGNAVIINYTYFFNKIRSDRTFESNGVLFAYQMCTFIFLGTDIRG